MKSFITSYYNITASSIQLRIVYIMSNKCIFITFYGIREYIGDMKIILESNGYIVDDYPYLEHHSTLNTFEILDVLCDKVENEKYKFMMFFILPGFIYNDTEGYVSFVSKLRERVVIPTVYYHMDNSDIYNAQFIKNSKGLDLYLTSSIDSYHKLKYVLGGNVEHIPNLHDIDVGDYEYTIKEDGYDNCSDILILYDESYDELYETKEVINRIKSFSTIYDQYDTTLRLQALNESSHNRIKNDYHDIYDGVYDGIDKSVALIIVLSDAKNNDEVIMRLMIFNVPIMLDYDNQLYDIINDRNCYIMKHNTKNEEDENCDLKFMAYHFDNRKKYEQMCRNAVNTVKDDSREYGMESWCNKFIEYVEKSLIKC